MDVALDPDFATDPWVYWTYSEPGTGAEAGLSGTAVARGRLVGSALQDVAVIYRQVPKVSGSGHFGSRLAFRGDRTLFVTLGERQKGSPAQDLATTLGKVDPHPAATERSPPTTRASPERGRRSGATATATRRGPRSGRGPTSSG